MSDDFQNEFFAHAVCIILSIVYLHFYRMLYCYPLCLWILHLMSLNNGDNNIKNILNDTSEKLLNETLTFVNYKCYQPQENIRKQREILAHDFQSVFFAHAVCIILSIIYFHFYRMLYCYPLCLWILHLMSLNNLHPKL
jgi:hypothetical protein